jgi:hypothetical protein
VLTAIEDFLKENRGRYRFFSIKKEFGLGILLKSGNGAGNTTFNKHLVKSKYINLIYSLKDVGRKGCPTLYSFLRRSRQRLFETKPSRQKA